MATIGMLSGFLTMRAKLGSKSDTAKKADADQPPAARATWGFQNGAVAQGEEEDDRRPS